MCVLYVSFGSKVRSRTFGRVVMGSAVLFVLTFVRIFRRVWSEQSASCFVWIECEIVMFCPDKNCMWVWLYVFLCCTCACVCR